MDAGVELKGLCTRQDAPSWHPTGMHASAMRVSPQRRRRLRGLHTYAAMLSEATSELELSRERFS